MNQTGRAWLGKPMTLGTTIELYKELERLYGADRVRYVIEVQPSAVLKTIDNEESAIKTLQNIRRRRLEAIEYTKQKKQNR
jgi:hypothetical protein